MPQIAKRAWLHSRQSTDLRFSQGFTFRARLQYPEEFAALDPCVGDGAAFSQLVQIAKAHAYGIEIDAYRAEQAAKLGIQVIQANALAVRCPPESVSMLI
jgi:hypothetical protein